MMKKTKTICCFLLMAIVVCTITGCNHSNSEDPILGVWKMKKILVDGKNMSTEEYMKSAQLKSVPTLTFETDGKVTLDTGKASGSAKWKCENGAYSIIDKSGDEPVIIEIKVKDEQLSLTQDGYNLTYGKQ